MPVPIHSITFWLNAFLPRDIAGYTTTLRDGPYAGLTAIAGLLCCLTDQRNFSNDIHAASRMHSQVTIDFTGPTPTMTQEHRCDRTIECDCNEGEVKRQQQADTSRMKFTLVSTDPIVMIRMDCLASNLCSSTPQAPKEIEYKGVIAIDLATRSISIDLMIGLFPAFEGYAAINDNVGSILFHYAPPAGLLATHIPPGANRLIRSRLEDRDGNGIFELPASSE